MDFMKKLRCNRGYTLTEMLIAALLTGILAAGGFEFYTSVHNQTIVQDDISDMQQCSRSILQDISKTLRMAGYKIGSHTPFAINGDSLYVFYSDSQAVDTVLYYLEDYASTDSSEYTWLSSIAEQNRPRKLLKKRNSNAAEHFADMINNIQYNQVSASSVIISLEIHAARSDEAFSQGGGFRTIAETERVSIRNISL
jgi:prepilin-type N-terminal cleavage/methylation domain-containing protein